MKARIVRSLAAVSASAVLLVAAPGFVGSASAHDGGSGSSSNDSGHVSSSLPVELTTAVKTARTAYFTAAWQAKDAYRAAVMAIRTTMQNETAPQLAAAQAAKKALDDAFANGADQATIDGLKAALRTAVENYRNALITSKTAHAGEFATALTNAKNAVAAAGVVYTQAVTAAFATYAPGTPIPSGLLNPPGHDFGKSFGHSQIEGLHLYSGKGRH